MRMRAMNAICFLRSSRQCADDRLPSRLGSVFPKKTNRGSCVSARVAPKEVVFALTVRRGVKFSSVHR